MSVFNRTSRNYATQDNPNPQVCLNGHEWNGARPFVDPNVHEWQHVSLVNMKCDCKKTTYWEELCGCSVPKWEIKERLAE